MGAFEYTKSGLQYRCNGVEGRLLPHHFTLGFPKKQMDLELLSGLKPWLHAAGRIIAPLRCMHCNNMLRTDWMLCLSCQRALDSCRIPPCELPGITPAGRTCIAVSYYRAGSPLRAIHRAAKYRSDDRAARWMARYLILGLRQIPPFPTELVCTPVPSHPARLLDRGLDLTRILACELAGAERIRFEPKLLRRRHLGSPQNDLDRGARIRNVEGVFACRDSLIPGTHVLLVDDVVTTGATLDAAASAVEIAGGHPILISVAFRRELFLRGLNER